MAVRRRRAWALNATIAERNVSRNCLKWRVGDKRGGQIAVTALISRKNCRGAIFKAVSGHLRSR